MLGNTGLGFYLLICHIAASLTVGIILRFFASKNYSNKKNSNNKHGSKIVKNFKNEFHSSQQSRTNIGILFGDAVKNSIMTLLVIGDLLYSFLCLLICYRSRNNRKIILCYFGVTKTSKYKYQYHYFYSKRLLKLLLELMQPLKQLLEHKLNNYLLSAL